MDMKRVLLIGDSGGIGQALRAAFEARGADVIGLSRSRDGFDFADLERVDLLLSELEPGFDTIFVASGVLTATRAHPEKSLRDLTPEELAGNFAANVIGPAMVLKHAPRLLPRKGISRCAVLSARVGSIGDNRAGGWYSYRSAKAGLNQILHSAAIELKRTHPEMICAALHPGTVETRFTENYKAAPKVVPKDAAQNLLHVLDGLTPKESGGFFDWKGAPVPW